VGHFTAHLDRGFRNSHGRKFILCKRVPFIVPARYFFRLVQSRIRPLKLQASGFFSSRISLSGSLTVRLCPSPTTRPRLAPLHAPPLRPSSAAALSAASPRARASAEPPSCADSRARLLCAPHTTRQLGKSQSHQAHFSHAVQCAFGEWSSRGTSVVRSGGLICSARLCLSVHCHPRR